MPRPLLGDKVRQAVRNYLAVAVTKTADEAPLNMLAVARQAGFDRKTLKKYGLDSEITAAAKQQARSGKIAPRELERLSHTEALKARDAEIAVLRQRCEGLVGQICLAEGNAQRLGIDPIEPWKPLPAPDRSMSRAGGWQTRRSY